MIDWRAFDDEIARWREAGRVAELWWRDDDAVEPTAALDRLLALRRDCGAPLALAVVPARAGAPLANRLAGESQVAVLQHGYAHANHAVLPDKKIELGLQRPAMHVLGELGTGWLALEHLFGKSTSEGGKALLPVLVPPWNRIAPALVPTLPEIGFAGLSTFGARARAHPVRGLVQVNTHLDLIDWQGSRSFVGAQTALHKLVASLTQSRIDSGEPVGLLSHHLEMDEGAWEFLKSLLGKAISTPGVGLSPAHLLFASREARA
jgi:hypothetical protein